MIPGKIKSPGRERVEPIIDTRPGGLMNHSGSTGSNEAKAHEMAAKRLIEEAA
jgi:hypothetical protein